MSVSRTSHYTPRSSASQGRIVTTNSALSAQFRDDPQREVVPASGDVAVNSHALNVVSSDLSVVNNPPNQSDRDKVEYVVVSKSRLSLNTNPELSENRSLYNTDLEKQSNNPQQVSDYSDQSKIIPQQELQLSKQEPDSANAPVEDEHIKGDLSNRYSYYSLKRSGNVSRNSTNSNALINQSQLQTGLNGVGTNSAHGANSNAVSLTENPNPEGGGANNFNARSTSILRSQYPSTEQSNTDTQRQGYQDSAHKNTFDAQHGDGHGQRLNAPQHTRLSLYSQPEPHSVDELDQSVPPLDLSRLSHRKSPVSDSDPVTPTPQTLTVNQNLLHASDSKSPLVHFTPHDYRGTARTYEVDSPYTSQPLPHVKSSAANFSGRQDTYRGEEDTFRAREEDKPSKVGSIHSDLADGLNVPYQFDTQAQEVQQSGYYDKPPSPPIPNSPPPDREPATSLRSNSQVYAVANPDIQRAQGINPPPNSQFTPRQYSSNTRKQSGSAGVRFDSASKHQSGSRGQGSPVRDRAPTPYNRSPPRSPGEYRPRSPPGQQRNSKPGSRGSRNTLPPQHPPLDTKHSHTTSARTEHRQDQRNKFDDSASVKRVYVESPTFTKAEEDEYRFVSSRLEEAEDKEQATFRNMEQTRRGYPEQENYDRQRDNRNRDRDEYNRKPIDQERFSDKNRDRYEDRNQGQYEDRGHDLNGYAQREPERHGDRYGQDRRNERDNYEDNDRYEDRNRYDPYNSQGKYEQLKDERSRYDREPYREDDPDFRQGFRKQNTEMDAEDLRKEQAYQAELKQRLEKQKIKEDDYMRPQDRVGFDKNNFARDSLEYPSEGDKGYARDSLEFNNYVNQGGQDWGDPPPNPYQEKQEEYYGNEFDNRGHLMKEDSKPAFYDPVDAARMEVVNPPQPKYDFVNLNKHDYGVPPKKSYRDLVHKKKEEEDRLDKIFITPKVPPKQGKKKKAQSAQPEHMGYHPPVQDQYPMGFKPSSAEELWAMRSNTLQNQSAGSKKGKGSAGKPTPQKWNSNPNIKHAHNFQAPPSLPKQSQPYKPPNMNYPPSPTGSTGQAGQGYTTPTRYLQPMDNKPAPPVSTEYVQPALEPNSPFRRHMELKPITQEIVTDDGQRISVDINLRLVSPPPGHNQSPPPGGAQHQLALLPVQETQGQGDPNENRPIGVPYTLQDQYGYENGYPAYSELRRQQLRDSLLSSSREKKSVTFSEYQGNGGLALEGTYNIEDQIAHEQMALADQTGNTGYAKRHVPGSSSYRDDESLDNDSGYTAMYHKNRSKDPNEKPWYKVYDITDYKKMQREVRLNRGTLGPDLDTEPYKEKLEKRHKQFEYARMVMEKNREELATNKPPKFPRNPDKQGEENIKRKAAIEYSKTIPKPTAKPRPNQYNSYEVAAQLGVGAQSGSKARHTSPTSKGSPLPTKTLDVIDIHTLEQRHLQERKTADKIKQNIESARPQKAN